jgi:hypothetical protein
MKKKFQVGDKVKLKINDETMEGMIIDFDVYGERIVFKIGFPHGEVDIDEKQLAEILSKRR